MLSIAEITCVSSFEPSNAREQKSHQICSVLLNAGRVYSAVDDATCDYKMGRAKKPIIGSS